MQAFIRFLGGVMCLECCSARLPRLVPQSEAFSFL